MAITWDTQITNVNTSSKRADVTFTRTNTETNATWSCSYNQVILETTAQRLALLDVVWADWQKALAKETSIDGFIGSLEQSANSNLMAREAV